MMSQTFQALCSPSSNPIPLPFFHFLARGQAVVAPFFRSVVNYYGRRGVVNFHLRVEERETEPFRVVVQFNMDNDLSKFSGEDSKQNCLGCARSNEGFDDEQKDLLIATTKLNHVWIDKKLRPAFIVTPQHHAESFSDISDDGLFSLYEDAMALLKEQLPPHGRFDSMRLNFGDFRNVPHLHLKIFVKKRSFRQCGAWKRFCATKTGKLEAALVEEREKARDGLLRDSKD